MNADERGSNSNYNSNHRWTRINTDGTATATAVSRKGAKAAKNCQELQRQEWGTATTTAHPQIAQITQIS
jgi:hypothetical protein